MNSHLTHEQLCNLLLAVRPSDAEALSAARSLSFDDLELCREHVAHCALCAGELADLTQSLDLFRSTANAWAHHAWDSQQIVLQRRRLEPVTAGSRLLALFQRPAVWGATAAAIVFATALPLTMHHLSVPETSIEATVPARTTPVTSQNQSDEALLLEINQTLSSSVPEPMQPLADPTAVGSNQSNAIRKD